MTAVVNVVQTLPVQGRALEVISEASVDMAELDTSPADKTETIVGTIVKEETTKTLELPVGMASLVTSVLRAVFLELAVAEDTESDDSTLRTELVAVKEPVVMIGVVAAIDMVGVLERP